MITGDSQTSELEASSLLVTSNSYVLAKYTLAVNEEKIILCAMALAKNFKTDFDHESFLELKASDFAKLADIRLGDAYFNLRRAAKTLLKRSITISEPDPVTKLPSELEFNILSACRYVPDARLIRLQFTKQIIPHFVNWFDGSFTQHEIINITRLSSWYAIRIYRIIKMELYKNKPVEIGLDFLREVLMLNGKYEKMCNFKKNVLDITVKEINESTDLNIRYENIKEGRNIIGFRFFWKENKKNKQKNIINDEGNTNPLSPENNTKLTAKQIDSLVNCEQFIMDYSYLASQHDSIEVVRFKFAEKLKNNPNEFKNLDIATYIK